MPINDSLTVNFGANKPTTIGELANLVVRTTGRDIPIEFDKSKAEGPLSRTPDLTRAKKVLGWEPKTPLIDGLRKTYLWLNHVL
jgi:nucleoside-diphosphate-sugar epimerase